MRCWLIFSLLLAGVGGALAQMDERKLIDRVTDPDREKVNTSFDVEFYGGQKFEQGKQAAVVEDFQYENRVNSKAFQVKDFAATSYWAGDFQFNTKNTVNLKGKPVKDGDKYATREFATEEVAEAGKKGRVKEFGEAGKVFRGKEADRMDKAIDPADQSTGWRGNMDVMSTDDIRDLLNKN